MIEHNEIPYLLENMQPDWLEKENQLRWYMLIFGLINGLIVGMIGGLFLELIGRY